MACSNTGYLPANSRLRSADSSEDAGQPSGEVRRRSGATSRLRSRINQDTPTGRFDRIPSSTSASSAPAGFPLAPAPCSTSRNVSWCSKRSVNCRPSSDPSVGAATRPPPGRAGRQSPRRGPGTPRSVRATCRRRRAPQPHTAPEQAARPFVQRQRQRRHVLLRLNGMRMPDSRAPPAATARSGRGCSRCPRPPARATPGLRCRRAHSYDRTGRTASDARQREQRRELDAMCRRRIAR